MVITMNASVFAIVIAMSIRVFLSLDEGGKELQNNEQGKQYPQH
jgi:hypothetical protein